MMVNLIEKQSALRMMCYLTDNEEGLKDLILFKSRRKTNSTGPFLSQLLK